MVRVKGIPDAQIERDAVQRAIARVELEVKVGVGLEDRALIFQREAVEDILAVIMRRGQL